VEQMGHGAPLILIHGSWSDKSTWDLVLKSLAKCFRTIGYDRRGYGESQRPGTHPDVHVTDLLALIRTLGLDHVALVGSSLGALVAIQAAIRAPELVRWVIAHEPPLLNLNEMEPDCRALADKMLTALDHTREALRLGDPSLAAQIYVDEALARPGTWKYVAEPIRRGFVQNAAAFFDDTANLRKCEVSLAALRELNDKLVVSRGALSNLAHRRIAEWLCEALPNARSYVFKLGGHVPHQTCPDEFVDCVLEVADYC